MKKFNKTLVLVFSSILFLMTVTACQNDIEKEENNMSTEENEQMEKEMEGNAEGKKQEEGTEGEKGEELSTNYETMLLREQKISDMIKSMDEVKEAEVAAYENNLLVAIVLQDDVEELNEELKEKIIEEVKSVDETIENIKITEDENIKEELKTTKESMQSDEPSEDLENRIRELFESTE